MEYGDSKTKRINLLLCSFILINHIFFIFLILLNFNFILIEFDFIRCRLSCHHHEHLHRMPAVAIGLGGCGAGVPRVEIQQPLVHPSNGIGLQLWYESKRKDHDDDVHDLRHIAEYKRRAIARKISSDAKLNFHLRRNDVHKEFFFINNSSLFNRLRGNVPNFNVQIYICWYPNLNLFSQRRRYSSLEKGEQFEF